MRWMEYSYTSSSLSKLVVTEWNIQITTLKDKNNLKWVIWKEKILWKTDPASLLFSLFVYTILSLVLSNF